jgi:pyruvate dehydrogenase E2 component (dihydrolipoamide acetyltransferase)
MFARKRGAAAEATVAVEKQGKLGSAAVLSPVRRTAARRMQESKQTIPHFYLQRSARAEALTARRNAALPTKLLWDAFIVKAVSNALKHFDKVAFRFENETLVPQDTTNIGIAADIDGELFVVSVGSPGEKGIEEISQEIVSAIDALRSGDANSRRMTPGIMTISNLGGSGIESFSAIINPPEAAILAVGAVRQVVVPNGDAFATEHRIHLTLSVDHRVVNGKYAAEFLAAIVREIESL